MRKYEDGLIDRPIRLLTKKHFPKSRGINIESTEKFLESSKYSKPLGIALEKEFGKRISYKEIEHKTGGTPLLINDLVIVVGKELYKINKRVNKQLKEKLKENIK